jgi:hypothetical protein
MVSAAVIPDLHLVKHEANPYQGVSDTIVQLCRRPAFGPMRLTGSKLARRL